MENKTNSIRKPMSDIVQSLVEWRKGHNLSQAALADRLGVRLMAVHRWENGRATPNKTARAKIAKLLEDQSLQGLPIKKDNVFSLSYTVPPQVRYAALPHWGEYGGGEGQVDENLARIELTSNEAHIDIDILKILSDNLANFSKEHPETKITATISLRASRPKNDTLELIDDINSFLRLLEPKLKLR